MNEIAHRPTAPMTADAFLAWPGDGTGRKRELVDGAIRAASPISRTHGTIQSRLSTQLELAIDSAALDLDVITEGAVIPGLNPSMNVRVPDILVAGTFDDEGQIAIPEPVLIVEVLSPGNQGDTRNNIMAFKPLASVREIVVMCSRTSSAK